MTTNEKTDYDREPSFVDQRGNQNRCTVTWGARTWPFVARCTGERAHAGGHTPPAGVVIIEKTRHFQPATYKGAGTDVWVIWLHGPCAEITGAPTANAVPERCDQCTDTGPWLLMYAEHHEGEPTWTDPR